MASFSVEVSSCETLKALGYDEKSAESAIQNCDNDLIKCISHIKAPQHILKEHVAHEIKRKSKLDYD